MLSFADILNLVSVLLAFDGLAFSFYMFGVAILATFLGKGSIAQKMFALALISFVLGGMAPGFGNFLIDARLPVVFMFCIGVLGAVFGIVGFFAICFSPSIYAFATNHPGKKWILPANLPLAFPFGPVFLFYFILKDPPKPRATTRVQPSAGSTPADPAPSPGDAPDPATPQGDVPADPPSSTSEGDSPGTAGFQPAPTDSADTPTQPDPPTPPQGDPPSQPASAPQGDAPSEAASASEGDSPGTAGFQPAPTDSADTPPPTDPPSTP